MDLVRPAGEPDQQQCFAEVIKVPADELDRLALGLGLFRGLALGLLVGALLLGFRLLLLGEVGRGLAARLLLEPLLALGLGRRLLGLGLVLSRLFGRFGCRLRLQHIGVGPTHRREVIATTAQKGDQYRCCGYPNADRVFSRCHRSC